MRGTFKTADNHRYEGEWAQGRFHGQGVYIFPSGAKYTGEFVNGVKSGTGRYEWKDGRLYMGVIVIHGVTALTRMCRDAAHSHAKALVS